MKKAKFKIGQTVYFLSNYTILEYQIKGISFKGHYDKEHNQIIEELLYHFTFRGVSKLHPLDGTTEINFTKKESEIFASEEEIFKTVFK